MELSIMTSCSLHVSGTFFPLEVQVHMAVYLSNSCCITVINLYNSDVCSYY